MNTAIRQCHVAHALLVIAIIGLAGCASKIPEEALRLNESALKIRAMQTRSYAVESETVILAATVAALQDMEYNIDTLEKSLGIISASKIIDVDHVGEEIAMIVVDTLCLISFDTCGAYAGTKDWQATSLTMVVLPSLERSDEFIVRVTLQRAVYDKQDRILTLEKIGDAEVYTKLFDKLNKSIFLEGES